MNEKEIDENLKVIEDCLKNNNLDEDYISQQKKNFLINILSSYDYIGVKIAMGVATKEEYANEIEFTELLREKIRKL